MRGIHNIVRTHVPFCPWPSTYEPGQRLQAARAQHKAWSGAARGRVLLAARGGTARMQAVLDALPPVQRNVWAGCGPPSCVREPTACAQLDPFELPIMLLSAVSWTGTAASGNTTIAAVGRVFSSVHSVPTKCEFWYRGIARAKVCACALGARAACALCEG